MLTSSTKIMHIIKIKVDNTSAQNFSFVTNFSNGLKLVVKTLRPRSVVKAPQPAENRVKRNQADSFNVIQNIQNTSLA